MRDLVILNPYSNRWQARTQRPDLENALNAQQVDYQLIETNGPGHATELAEAEARSGAKRIIAAGGDGTIGEVLNGLYRAAPQGEFPALGIIPLGTANDLVVNLGLPRTIPESVQAFKNGKTMRIDLGQVNEWVYANNSAVGLEPVVTLYNIRMKRLKGVVRYLVAALRAIASGPRWQMHLTWDDGEYSGPVSLVSVGNCPITGGLFRMAPAADPSDGKLTFVYGFAPTKWKMLTLLPRAISGSYVNDPVIHQHHTRHLSIQSVEPTPLQADGEIRGEDFKQLTYEALPSRLSVFCT
ncbi:MAG: diacylglycerol/lipid kinase family protein [Anaerolineales bacterium]